MTDDTTNTEQSRVAADCPNERVVSDFLSAKRENQGEAVEDATRVEIIGDNFRVTLPCKDLVPGRPFVCNRDQMQRMINDLYR